MSATFVFALSKTNAGCTGAKLGGGGGGGGALPIKDMGGGAGGVPPVNDMGGGGGGGFPEIGGGEGGTAFEEACGGSGGGATCGFANLFDGNLGNGLCLFEPSAVLLFEAIVLFSCI